MNETMQVVRKKDEVEEVRSRVEEFKSKAGQIVINDKPSFDVANSILKEARKRRKAIEDKFDSHREQAYKAYKGWLNLINELSAPLKAVEKEVKKKIGVYLAEQERIRQAEIEKKRKEEEEKRLRDAEAMEAVGKTEEAEKIVSKRMTIKDKPKKMDTGGTYTIKNWYAEVTDIKTLCRAVADGKVSQDLVQANMPTLNRMAKQQHEKMSIPGVKADYKTSVGTR